MQVTALTDGTFIARPRYFGPDAVSHPRSDVFDRAGAAWLPIGSFLVRAAGRTILVDAGLGPELQQLPEDMYLVGGQLLTGLRAAGVDREEITDVVCTHLHADHVGWLFDEDAEPVFPAASIWFGAGDWHHFVDGPGEMAPHIERGLRSSTQVKLLDQDTTVARGVDAIMTPGHTPGTCPWPSTGAPSASCCSATPSPARSSLSSRPGTRWATSTRRWPNGRASASGGTSPTAARPAWARTSPSSGAAGSPRWSSVAGLPRPKEWPASRPASGSGSS
jgi:hypothetical protein